MSIYNTAFNILQNAGDAEDISQEVFMEVYRSIGGFKGQSKLSTWIYKITLSKCYTHVRKSRTQKRFGLVHSLFKPDSVSLQYDQPEFNHPGVVLEDKETAAYLFAALNTLPENQRSAFVLHKLEGLSYNEIAEILVVSLSAVESLIFRAKQNLQKTLAHYYDKNIK